MIYRDLCNSFNLDCNKMVRLDSIEQPYSDELAKQLFHSMKPNEFTVIEGGGFPVGCSYWLTVTRVKDSLYIYNNEHVINVTINGDNVTINKRTEPTDEVWKEVFLAIGFNNIKINQYHYCDLVIDSFWRSVFNKSLSDIWCSGIVSAHGDKAYSYKDGWEEKGIPFNRGVLIYLLTYTSERGDQPKHESYEWVIENYQKYLPLILEAEKEAGL